MDWTLTQIALVVLCALVAGMAFSFVGCTPVVGYIIAGIILGPNGMRFISNTEAIGTFSEIGILLLLFAIGLGLSFERIKDIWRKSFGVTALSTIFIYVLVVGIGYFCNLSKIQAMIAAFCITLSSTAVTAKSLDSLQERDESIESNTYGVLIAQDLVAILMVIIINLLGSTSADTEHRGSIASIVLLLLGLLAYFAKFHRYIHKFTDFISNHKEVLTMTVFGLCLGGAVIAEVSGLSAPFGAFIIGVILGNSNIKEQVKIIIEPLEEIFLMSFFLGVGLLVDMQFISQNIWIILGALLFVTIIKTILNICVLRIYSFSLKESFVISVLLGHIGEFSFMLANAAEKSGVIGEFGVKFLVSLTVLSLFVSPFWFMFAERCRELAKDSHINSSWAFGQLAFHDELNKCSKVITCIISFFNSMFVVVQYKIKEILERLKKK